MWKTRRRRHAEEVGNENDNQRAYYPMQARGPDSSSPLVPQRQLIEWQLQFSYATTKFDHMRAADAAATEQRI